MSVTVDFPGLSEKLRSACNKGKMRESTRIDQPPSDSHWHRSALARLQDASQIMLLSPADLQKRLRLTARDTHELLSVTALALQPPSLSVLDLLVGAGMSSSHAGPSTPTLPEEASGQGFQAPVAMPSAEIASLSPVVLGKRRATDIDDEAEVSGALVGQLDRRPLGAITTGDGELDAILGGGIHVGCLTEILGEPASGKSQLITQLAAYTALGLLPIGEVGQRHCTSRPAESELYTAFCGVGVASHGGGDVVIVTGNKAEQGVLAQRLEDIVNAAVRERWRASHNLRFAARIGHSEARNKPAASAREIAEINAGANTECDAAEHTPAPSHEDGSDDTTRAARAHSDRQEEDHIAQRAIELVLSRVLFIHRRGKEGLDEIIQEDIPKLFRRLHLGEPSSSAPHMRPNALGCPSPPVTPPPAPRNVRLIIIDALPEFVPNNPDEWSKGLQGRSAYLSELSDKLKRLSLSRPGSDGSPIPRPERGAKHGQSDEGIAVVVSNWAKSPMDSEMASARSAIVRGFAGPLAPQNGDGIPGIPEVLRQQMEEGAKPPLFMTEHMVHDSGTLASVPRNFPANNGAAISFDLFLSKVEERLFSATYSHVWTNCINVRLMLCRTSRLVPRSVAPTSREFDTGLPKMMEMRRAVVVASPFAPAGTHAGRAAERDFFLLPSGVKCLAPACESSHTPLGRVVDLGRYWHSHEEEAAEWREADEGKECEEL